MVLQVKPLISLSPCQCFVPLVNVTNVKSFGIFEVLLNWCCCIGEPMLNCDGTITIVSVFNCVSIDQLVEYIYAQYII